MADVRKLDAVLPKELREFAAQKINDYLDKELVIWSCREVTGTRGAYMRIVVSLEPEGDKFHLATGAAQPMEVLSYLDKNFLFPVSGKFVKSGNAIVLKA